MTEKKLLTLVVGMHFNPPAKWLVQVLKAGTELALEKDPGNPYDPNAIKVYLRSGKDIPESQHRRLEELLVGSGYDLVEVTQDVPWMLGHLAASGNKPLAKAQTVTAGLVGNVEVLTVLEELGRPPESVQLAFAVDGAPLAILTWYGGALAGSPDPLDEPLF